MLLLCPGWSGCFGLSPWVPESQHFIEPSCLSVARALIHLASYSGEEATALHVADFAIDGRCLLLGPATPSFQRRLDALNSLADPGGQTFAGLPAGARSRVCGWA